MSKTFTQTLAELNAGAIAQELDDQLHAVVKSVRDTGGKGRITLTLDIKMAKGNQTAVVEADVKAKVPTFERAPDFFFIGRDNSLLRDHPNQQTLQLRPVAMDPETGEVLDATPAPAPVREVAAI